MKRYIWERSRIVLFIHLLPLATYLILGPNSELNGFLIYNEKLLYSVMEVYSTQKIMSNDLNNRTISEITIFYNWNNRRNHKLMAKNIFAYTR